MLQSPPEGRAKECMMHEHGPGPCSWTMANCPAVRYQARLQSRWYLDWPNPDSSWSFAIRFYCRTFLRGVVSNCLSGLTYPMPIRYTSDPSERGNTARDVSGNGSFTVNARYGSREKCQRPRLKKRSGRSARSGRLDLFFSFFGSCSTLWSGPQPASGTPGVDPVGLHNGLM